LLQDPGATGSSSGYIPCCASGGTFGQPEVVLRDGSAGGNTLLSTDWPNLALEANNPVGANGAYSVTFNLDLTSAPKGYDITQIDSYSGWLSNRDGHVHNIFLSTDGTLFTQINGPFAGAWGSGSLASGQNSHKVSITEDTTGIIASGVVAIRFDMLAGGAIGHVYRELDVFGSPVPIPEPSTAVLGVLAMSGVAIICRRRKVGSR